MRSFLHRFSWTLALVFLVGINGFFLYSWAKKEVQPLAWDQATHTKNAYEYRDRLAHSPLSELFRPVDWNYPPLYNLAMIPFLDRVADVADAGVFVNIFYFSVLIVAVFLIGQKILGPWPAFTAAALVTCFPTFVDLSRNTLIDLSLTAWVALSFYCLLSSDNFSKKNWSVLFGATMGLGMLTKWTALAYLVFPLLPVFIRAVRAKRFLNLGLSLFTCAVIMAPWYLGNFLPIAARIPHMSSFPPAGGSRLTGWENFFWYPLSFGEQMGLVYFVLFVPGLIIAIFRPKLRPLVLWMLGTLILFSLIRNRNNRYFAPALPALALLTVAWLPSFKRWSYLLTLAVTIGIFWGSVVQGQSTRTVRFLWQDAQLLSGRPPLRHDWKHGDIARRIREVHGSSPQPAHVLVVSNHHYFFSQSFVMSMRSQGSAGIAFHGARKRRPFEFADFVLFKTDHLGPPTSLGATLPCVEIIKKSGSWFEKSFKEVGRWMLPDGSEGILYRFNPEPQAIPDAGMFNLSLKSLSLPNIEAFQVNVTVTPISKKETQLGRFKEMVIKADRLIYKKVEFSRVKIRFENPQINLPYYFEEQDILLGRLGALQPSATVKLETLLNLAAKKAKWLKNPQIKFEGSHLEISGRPGGIPLFLAIQVEIQDKVLHSKILKVRLAGIPLPLILFSGVTDKNLSLSRGEEWAYSIDIGRIQGEQSSIRMGQ